MDLDLGEAGRPVPPADDGAALSTALAAVAAGNLASLDEIYDACGADLFGIALWRCGCSEDASDAVQDVFVRLAQTGADLGRVRSPRAYLLAMAHRSAVDILRRRRGEVALDDAFLEPVAEDREAETDAARLSELLRRLPPAQREAVYLRHFQELSFAEIGSVTGVPMFTAASRCRLGLHRLRRLMGVER